MKVSEILNSLKGVEDSQILLIIKQGIAKIAAFYMQEENERQVIRRKRNLRCISVTTFPKFIDSNAPKSAQKIRPSSLNIYPISVKMDFENIFNLLADKYKSSSWVKLKDHVEIHIALIKQFWLDCYVCDGNFFGLLLDGISNKIWVQISEFAKAIENAQKVNSFTVFSLKRYDKKWKKSLQTQKMICNKYLVFFCFLQFEVGLNLNKENLFRVLSMANKKEKTHLCIWAEQFINGANKLRKEFRETINFEEFVNLIINSI